jgi:hypothetical protein
MDVIREAIATGGLSTLGRTWVVNTEKLPSGFDKIFNGYIGPDRSFKLDAALSQAVATGTDAYVSSNPNVHAGSDTRFTNVSHSLTGGTDFTSNKAALMETLGRGGALLRETQKSRQQELDGVNSQLGRLGVNRFLDPSVPVPMNQNEYDAIKPGTHYYGLDPGTNQPVPKVKQ